MFHGAPFHILNNWKQYIELPFLRGGGNPTDKQEQATVAALEKARQCLSSRLNIATLNLP
jgi:hypothetical protein